MLTRAAKNCPSTTAASIKIRPRARCTVALPAAITPAALALRSWANGGRSFATSSKPARAVAAAGAVPSTTPDLHFASTNYAAPNLLPSSYNALQNPKPFTVLPTPLPHTAKSALNETHYLSSETQSKLALILACISDLLDVERAGKIFDSMRDDLLISESILDVSVYNKMLNAYFEKAAQDRAELPRWLDRAWDLYDDMAQGKRNVCPDAYTFAAALDALRQLPDECLTAGKAPREILQDISRSNPRISLESIVTQDGLLTASEAQPMLEYLSNISAENDFAPIAAEAAVVQQKFAEPLFDPLSDIPDVEPVLKKVESKYGASEGTSSDKYRVPHNIEALRQDVRELIEGRSETDLITRQLAMERTVYETAVERFRKQAEDLKKLEIHTGLNKASLQAWMWDWYQKLRERLSHDLEMIREKEEKSDEPEPKGRSRKDPPLVPFLSCLSPDTLAILTIMEVMSLQSVGGVDMGVKTTRALMEVGRAVEAEYQTRLLQRHRIHNPYSKGGNVPLTTEGLKALIERRKVAQKDSIRRLPAQILEWTQQIRLKVGGFCVDALMDVATVTRTATIDGEEYSEEQPAFSHTYDYQRGFKVGILRINPVVARQLEEDDVHALVHPRQLPMLVQPRPWIDAADGGYLTGRSQVMRIRESVEQTSYLRQAAQDGKLELIFRGLDVLGSTCWVINKDLYKVALEVWNSGQELAGIPPSSVMLPEPPKPDNYDTDLKVKADYEAMLRKLANEKRNNHSDRCSVNYKMEIARAFIGEEMFFPHNVDFRGRAYPIPPHLSHIGDDLSRGLMKFAEARPLGARGLRWLKIHLANVFGNDKASFDDREKFTEEHLDDVYDSAENPLNGRRWWLKADDPWQCLATCMELRATLESPNPLEFMSNLPVHQDGTCNGLQHYAALGGDAEGAAQVNLDVTERPSDVYSYVAQMVEKEIIKDIAAGNKEAKLISGKVARKVVKQTVKLSRISMPIPKINNKYHKSFKVMTTVYGVTLIGARAQIERQLRDRGDIPVDHCWNLAAYLARKTIGCIGDLFKGANAIQDWLTVSARAISRSIPPERQANCLDQRSEAMDTNDALPTRGRPSKAPLVRTDPQKVRHEQMTSVIWTTALGLPIVQPYRKVKRTQVMTGLQTVFIADPNTPTEVSPQKQGSAFPPNFIHSLDATHMILTALEMSNHNLTFASVHDSYWTHACSIDEMSMIIRDTFVELHSKNILERLRDEFVERYDGHRVPFSSLRADDVDRILKRKDLTDAERDTIAKLTGKSLVKRTILVDADVIDEDGLFVPRTSRKKSKKSASTGDAKEAVVKTDVVLEADATPDTVVEEQATGRFNDRFVDLSLLIPALPERGTFDVSRTRKSLYFFS
ncbi:DNA-directed RNA polymerase [Tulasnella sp. 403]|nr:DNA-directed RNA polymerase [Tulasnella sp. 403]